MDRANDQRQLLRRIISDQAVTPLFQPIVDLGSGRLVAVEALARGPAGPLHMPDALFAAAIEAGLLHELDTLCAALALRTAREFAGELPPLLFVNADPGAFTRRPNPQLAAELHAPVPYRTVLEFTERALDTNPTSLLQVAQMVHRLGNALALDDVGAEPLSLAFLPLLEPEVVKLDMSLLRDPHSRHAITTVTRVDAYAQRYGGTVIAEGIETEDDRRTALAWGARWGQGWLFGRPGPLDALAGMPIDRDAHLRAAPGPVADPSSESMFVEAAKTVAARRGDLSTVAAFAGQLLQDLAVAGDHGVLLATDTSPTALEAWLPGYTERAARAAYAARVAGFGDPAAPAEFDEGAVVTVSPHLNAALCFRRLAGGEFEFVLVHGRAAVLRLARRLLSHLGTGLAPAGPPVRVPVGALAA